MAAAARRGSVSRAVVFFLDGACEAAPPEDDRSPSVSHHTTLERLSQAGSLLNLSRLTKCGVAGGLVLQDRKHVLPASCVSSADLGESNRESNVLQLLGVLPPFPVDAERRQLQELRHSHNVSQAPVARYPEPRWGSLRVLLVSNCQRTHELVRKLRRPPHALPAGVLTQHLCDPVLMDSFDQLSDFVCSWMENPANSSGAAAAQVLFCHIAVDRQTAASIQRSVCTVDSLLGRALALQPQQLQTHPLYLAVVASYGDGPFPIGNHCFLPARHNPLALLRPRQSFELLDGFFGDNSARSASHAIPIAHYCPGVTRVDNTTAFTERLGLPCSPAGQQSAMGLVHAKHLLMELAFVLGCTPKYGA